MSPDKQALRETMDMVLAMAARGEHDQDVWVRPSTEASSTEFTCGTQACFCGTRALMDGAQVLTTNFARLPDGTLIGEGMGYDGDSWTEWGRKRFGISPDQATELFWGNNSLEDLKAIVDRICDGP